jgi:hypothetical protein
MAASNHHESPEVFPRDMMRANHIDQPTARPSTASWRFAQGIARLVAKVGSFSGRTAE